MKPTKNAQNPSDCSGNYLRCNIFESNKHLANNFTGRKPNYDTCNITVSIKSQLR